ncbi:hypothetical protein CF641_38235 [Burkholderia pseudomallei]|nr:hypothetical protein CF641_38230 [Burkholderia pseudomallei]PNW89243.1 hypothetical protein CF641_38235 [Burkholderia pseudomallei]
MRKWLARADAQTFPPRARPAAPMGMALAAPAPGRLVGAIRHPGGSADRQCTPNTRLAVT